MNNLPTPLIAAAVFALLFVLERFFPLRNTTRSLVARLFVNLAISVFTFIAAAGLVQPTARWALRWSAGRPFGLVHVIALPVPLEFVLSFMLMDLGFYHWHVANHRVPFLWRFHNVHHIDPDLDVSTAFRFHFGEIALSTGFSLLQLSLIGPSAWVSRCTKLGDWRAVALRGSLLFKYIFLLHLKRRLLHFNRRLRAHVRGLPF